jgi:hypothetical protein
MDNKLLLIKVISLLHVEGLLMTRSDDILSLSRDIINTTELPNAGAENDYGREVIEGLLSTAGWMVQCVGEGTPVGREDLLQRITMNSQGESFIVEALIGFLEITDDKEKMTAYRDHTIYDIQSYKAKIAVDQIIAKARRTLMFESAKIDWSSFVRNLTIELEPYHRVGGVGGLEDLGVMERINVGELDNIKDQFLSDEDANDPIAQQVFKFGWQGLNRAFGDAEGLRRVDVLCVSALSHNFKSGKTSNMFRQAAQYNTPIVQPGRIPMLLHISYEQSVEDTYKGIYSQIILNEQGIRVDPKKVNQSIEEVSAIVKDRLEKNGWKVEFIRVDPDNSNFRKLFALIEYYEKLGYEIQLCVIDYLGKLNREGCTQGVAGADIKNMYSRVRNFFNKKRIALITAHQMSSEALGLTKMGVTDQLVNEVAGRGFYDGCRTLHQELDMELYIHIVEYGGRSYLCSRRGKHRISSITPSKDLYYVYKFAENLAPGFPDDVLGQDMSMRKPGEDQGDVTFVADW